MAAPHRLTRTLAESAAPPLVCPRMAATAAPLGISRGMKYCCTPPLPVFAFGSSAKPTSRLLMTAEYDEPPAASTPMSSTALVSVAPVAVLATSTKTPWHVVVTAASLMTSDHEDFAPVPRMLP